MDYSKYILHLLQDQKSNRKNTKGKIITFIFRASSYQSKNIVTKVFTKSNRFVYKVLIEYLLGIELPYNTKVGKGLTLYHGQSLVVHKHTIIGDNCTLRQSTTIGNNGKTKECPIIGNGVNIGANVCIIGPVIIGNNVDIGAGSVVVNNIPDFAVVVGNPARIIRIKEVNTYDN
ncbi:serine acetyltransferase [Tellurirhabdus rosea]|uniref:serine acetyltransferase n=1 Tax=Tellurirhabdus rosea TaxID=2674997 RepID=UPI0022544E0B|nr:serine acetyltransferase [Tellurirhabdus rosea]